MSARQLSVVLALLAYAAGANAQPLAPRVIASQGDPDLTLPQFRPGLWEYRRTQINSTGGKPQTATIRKCADPSAEFAHKLAELRQRGCVFKPLKQNGQHYEATWRCSAPDGAVLAMRDIITVTSDTSYQNDSEAFVAHEATHSTIVAIRLGNCAAPASSVAAPAPSAAAPNPSLTEQSSHPRE
jgi:hypothetical protein